MVAQKMFLACLCGVVASSKTLNMSTFLNGDWNLTKYTSSKGSELVKQDLFLKFSLDFVNGKHDELVATFEDRPNMELNIKLDGENLQSFKVLNVSSLHPVTLMESTMEYARRNLPYAQGSWKNGKDHFKLVVFSPYHVELDIYHPDNTLTVYRLLRAAKPVQPTVWSVIQVPVILGSIMIVYRLYEARKMIKRRDEALKKAKEVKKKD